MKKANNHDVPELTDVVTPTLSLHYIEALDSLANIAKATGTYNIMVNSLLTVTSVILSELAPDQVTETMNMIFLRQQAFREQQAARKAADVVETATAQDTTSH